MRFEGRPSVRSKQSFRVLLVISSAILAVFSLLLAPSAAAGQLEPGQPAPEFSLSSMDGKEIFTSQLLFSTTPFTLLVFWNTECEDCLRAVEECDALADSLRARNILLVGINHEAGDIGAALDFLHGEGVRFLQLSDIDKRVAAEYGVERFSFSLVLTDSAGVVQDLFYDTPPDVRQVLFDMLARAEENRTHGTGEPPGQTEAGGSEVTAWSGPEPSTRAGAGGIRTERVRSGIRVRGDLRLRAMDLQVLQDKWSASAPSGPYGEALEKGKSLTHRFQCEVSGEVTSWLTAGALLRLSNESPDLLVLGPQYFSNELGSVFARYAGGSFSARLGYFEAYFTPLSLMRWDLADSPRTGGRASGCACAGSAGAYLLQSLEELGPTLTFEGFDAVWRFQSFASLRAFYAIPRTAHEISYAALYSGGESLADFRYRRDLYGVRAEFDVGRFARKVGPKVSIHSVVTRDDEESASLPVQGYDWLVSAINNQVYGGTLTIPMGGRFSVEAEFDRTRIDDDVRTASDKIRYGKGLLATASADLAAGLRASAAYLYTSDDFVSSYKALSYSPNRRGARMNVSAHRKWLSMEVFARYLEPVQPDSTESTSWSTLVLKHQLTIGAWGSRPLLGGIEAGAGWVLERDAHDAYEAGGVYLPEELGYGRGLNQDKHIFTAQLDRGLGRESRAELVYQYTTYSDKTDSRADFTSHRTSLQVKVAF